jgi:hypothetical protein
LPEGTVKGPTAAATGAGSGELDCIPEFVAAVVGFAAGFELELARKTNAATTAAMIAAIKTYLVVVFMFVPF